MHRVVIPVELLALTTELNTKAIEIRATEEVVAYGFNKQPYSNDGFLALPVDALGTLRKLHDYIVTRSCFKFRTHSMFVRHIINGAT